MKKKIIMFLLLLLFPCFVFAEDEKSLVTNTNKLSFDISGIHEQAPGNNLKLSDNSYIMHAVTEESLVVQKVCFDGKVEWKIKIPYNEYFDSFLYDLNETEILILTTEKIMKVNKSDGSIVKENNNITGFKIIEYKDEYVALDGQNLIFFNDELEISEPIVIDTLLKEVIESSNVAPLHAVRPDLKFYGIMDMYYSEDDRQVYLLGYGVTISYDTSSTSLERASDTANVSYEYYILSVKDDFVASDISVVNKISYESDEEDVLNLIDSSFIKVDDNFYMVSHDSGMFYKVSLDGTISNLNENRLNARYSSMVYNGKYFILSGIEHESFERGYYPPEVIVDIYDKDLKLLETINLSDFYLNDTNANNTRRIVVISGDNVSLIDGGFIVTGVISENDLELLAEYKIPYNIETKTDDNGSIEVISEAIYGDMITFNVRARSGYRLSTLTVTNSSLETVTFTEDELILNEDGTFSLSRNSFKMPSSDVEINATFEKIPENPNTIDNIVFYTGMFIVSLGLVIGILVYRKKHL